MIRKSGVLHLNFIACTDLKVQGSQDPDDFILAGTYSQQWERLGNSVPPIMMKAIAETVRDKVLAR